MGKSWLDKHGTIWLIIGDNKFTGHWPATLCNFLCSHQLPEGKCREDMRVRILYALFRKLVLRDMGWMWIIKNGGGKFFSFNTVEIYATRSTPQKREQEVIPWQRRGEWGPRCVLPYGNRIVRKNRNNRFIYWVKLLTSQEALFLHSLLSSLQNRHLVLWDILFLCLQTT